MATTIETIATLLGTNTSGAAHRLSALGYLVPCSRCGGSGHYSRCQQYGTMCFGCKGKGQTLPKLTAKIAKEAKARQDAGELDSYFAANRARAAARKEIAPLVAEAEVIYKMIGDAYTAAGKVATQATRACDRAVEYFPNIALTRAQTMNNAIFFGLEGDTVSGLDWRVKQGREDATRAVRELRARIEELKALRDAAAPSIAEWIANPTPRDEWSAGRGIAA